MATQVRTGTIGINRHAPGPSSLFGGVQASGIGRELGPNALTSYQPAKTIYR